MKWIVDKKFIKKNRQDKKRFSVLEKTLFF